MAKGRLLALLSGAALAGGIIYLKNHAEILNPAPAAEGEPEGEPADAAWKAAEPEGGEEVSAEEMTERFKEDAAKAFAEFKGDAKAVTDEILVGLK